MKTFCMFLSVAVVAVCISVVTPAAWGETLVYAARGTSDTAAGIDPTTVAYTGTQSYLPGPPRADLLGGDISMGSNYAYMVGTDGMIHQLDKSTLGATGVTTNWGGGNIFASVDVGADGFIYGARNGDTAAKIDPLTLAYTGIQSHNGGVDEKGPDVSVGRNYAYMVDTEGHIIQLAKDTLNYTGVYTNWGGGSLFTRVDVGADGYVYGARGTADTAVRIDPTTLSYTGVQTLAGNPGSYVDFHALDISVGTDYAYAINANDNRVYRLDMNLWTGSPSTKSSWPSGGNLFVSVDTSQVPEPGTLSLLGAAALALLAFGWRKRK